ncbi:MAG: DUF58 domain-containing protein, partial [Flavobacteriales bacterium]
MILLYILAWVTEFFALPALILLVGLFTLVVIETILLYLGPVHPTAQRSLTKMMSLGDNNLVILEIENKSIFKIDIEIYDEIPFQFQVRDFHI